MKTHSDGYAAAGHVEVRVYDLFREKPAPQIMQHPDPFGNVAQAMLLPPGGVLR